MSADPHVVRVERDVLARLERIALALEVIANALEDMGEELEKARVDRRARWK